jgi:hypothetical protein
MAESGNESSNIGSNMATNSNDGGSSVASNNNVKTSLFDWQLNRAYCSRSAGWNNQPEIIAFWSSPQMQLLPQLVLLLLLAAQLLLLLLFSSCRQRQPAQHWLDEANRPW